MRSPGFVILFLATSLNDPGSIHVVTSDRISFFLSLCAHVHILYVFVHVFECALGGPEVCVLCIFLNHSSPYFFETISHWSWSSPIQLDWLDSKPQGASCLCLSPLELHMDAGYLNSCPSAGAGNSSPTESPPHLQAFSLLDGLISFSLSTHQLMDT